MPPDAMQGTSPPVTPPVTPPAVPPPASPIVPSTWDEVFQHPRFKELNQRAKDAEAQLVQLQETQRQAAEAKLADEKKWEQLAQQREVELKRERAERLRASVALAKGLPPDLAARLQGDDEAALNADADKLLALVQAAAKGAQGPGVPPSPGPGGRPVQVSLANMTPAQIREAYDKGQLK